MGCTESRKERRLNHVPVGACVRYIFFCVFICCYNLDDKSVRDSALTPRNPQSTIEILETSSEFIERSQIDTQNDSINGTGCINA